MSSLTEGLVGAIDQRASIAQEYRWRYLGLVSALAQVDQSFLECPESAFVELGPANHPRGALGGFLPADLGQKVISIDANAGHLDSVVGESHKVVGDGCDLPLQADSVDGFFSTDVLEHVETGDRKRLLAEAARVVKPGGYVVLGFPTGQPAARLDMWLNNLYKRGHNGEEHPYLVEHIANGLPDLDEVVNQVDDVGLELQRVVPNSNYYFWKADSMLQAVGQSERVDTRIAKCLQVGAAVMAQTLISARLIDRGSTYRQILVTKKPANDLQ